MKDRIHKGINDFVSACYTFWKIGAGDFAENNFHKIVDEAWDGTKSVEAYMKGWFSKITE